MGVFVSLCVIPQIRLEAGRNQEAEVRGNGHHPEEGGGVYTRMGAGAQDTCHVCGWWTCLWVGEDVCVCLAVWGFVDVCEFVCLHAFLCEHMCVHVQPCVCVCVCVSHLRPVQNQEDTFWWAGGGPGEQTSCRHHHSPFLFLSILKSWSSRLKMLERQPRFSEPKCRV